MSNFLIEDLAHNGFLLLANKRCRRVKTLSHALGSAFKNECLSELQVRKILHHCGYKTFPRPKGIPQNWKIMISEKGGGMIYRKVGTTKNKK
ncbi:MAG: hypothetical protein H7A42_02235 [Chlamydiales bacterium]|nr:hypothetical protein [Chlamydiales bacterium]